MNSTIIITSLCFAVGGLSARGEDECILSDGSRLVIQTQMRERDVFRYDLIQKHSDGKTTSLWQSHEFPKRGNGGDWTKPFQISLGSISSVYENEEGASVTAACIESDIMVFFLPKNATQAKAIRIGSLLSGLDPPGHFELRGHRELAYVVEDLASRLENDIGIVRFDESGKITEDFRPRSKPVFKSVTAARDPANSDAPAEENEELQLDPSNSGEIPADGEFRARGWHFAILGVVILGGVGWWILQRREPPSTHTE